MRAYLLAELDELGVEPQLHEAVGIWPRPTPGLRAVGLVGNVLGIIEGHDPTGQIVLAAHYDSVPSKPGLVTVTSSRRLHFGSKHLRVAREGSSI